MVVSVVVVVQVKGKFWLSDSTGELLLLLLLLLLLQQVIWILAMVFMVMCDDGIIAAFGFFLFSCILLF